MANVWWVTQGDTYWDTESRETLWAPLYEAGTTTAKHFWTRMSEPRPGDLVIHFAEKHIRGISTVITPPVLARSPYTQGSYAGVDGRSFNVAFVEFDTPLLIDEIDETLRTGEDQATASPFRSDGTAKIGYLFAPSDEVIKQVFEKRDLVTDDLEAASADFAFAGVLDRKASILARREQDRLRRHLLRGRTDAPCGLCSGVFPGQLLVAAHIKPRQFCSDDEARQGAVAMLACKLGCDALFELGMITVDTNGVIVTRLPGGKADEHLTRLTGETAPSWSPETETRFSWHSDHHSLQGPTPVQR